MGLSACVQFEHGKIEVIEAKLILLKKTPGLCFMGD